MREPPESALQPVSSWGVVFSPGLNDPGGARRENERIACRLTETVERTSQLRVLSLHSECVRRLAAIEKRKKKAFSRCLFFVFFFGALYLFSPRSSTRQRRQAKCNHAADFSARFFSPGFSSRFALSLPPLVKPSYCSSSSPLPPSSFQSPSPPTDFALQCVTCNAHEDEDEEWVARLLRVREPAVQEQTEALFEEGGTFCLSRCSPLRPRFLDRTGDLSLASSLLSGCAWPPRDLPLNSLFFSTETRRGSFDEPPSFARHLSSLLSLPTVLSASALTLPSASSLSSLSPSVSSPRKICWPPQSPPLSREANPIFRVPHALHAHSTSTCEGASCSPRFFFLRPSVRTPSRSSFSLAFSPSELSSFSSWQGGPHRTWLASPSSSSWPSSPSFQSASSLLYGVPSFHQRRRSFDCGAADSRVLCSLFCLRSLRSRNRSNLFCSVLFPSRFQKPSHSLLVPLNSVKTREPALHRGSHRGSQSRFSLSPVFTFLSPLSSSSLRCPRALVSAAYAASTSFSRSCEDACTEQVKRRSAEERSSLPSQRVSFFASSSRSSLLRQSALHALGATSATENARDLPRGDKRNGTFPSREKKLVGQNLTRRGETTSRGASHDEKREITQREEADERNDREEPEGGDREETEEMEKGDSEKKKGPLPPPLRLSAREIGRRFRRAALQEQHRPNIAQGCFPVEAVFQHPDLLNGLPFRRLGGAPPPRPRGASPPVVGGAGTPVDSGQSEEDTLDSAAKLPKDLGGKAKRPQDDRGMLVSGLCIGTSMVGSTAMIDDGDARELLHCAYGEYGINFFDVGELDPIPFAPATHGRGHVEVLRPFLRAHRARAASQTACTAAERSGSPASSLEAEMRQIRISARILGGGLSGFRQEREALKREMQDADMRGDTTGVRWAWGEHDPDTIEGESDSRQAEEIWSRDRGWWTRKDRAERRMQSDHVEQAVDDLLLRLGIDCVDLLQFDVPHRYVPRHELGEDTYCWGLEREDEMAIEEQLVILQRLVDKGKVRYIGLSNETPWGVFKWCTAADQMGLSRVASVQTLYNIMHRNEFESSGFPEMLWNLNVPLLAYGVLAGGVLTGKYLDPERFNPRGPDERLGQDEWDNAVATYRTQLPEDSGYLSYGPANGRCNKWKESYSTHRSVWAQWLMGELVKAARQFGLTASQLALSWVYSRPFLGSAIIGPRTIGQLRESIRALNYPVPPALEAVLHDLFLRYRAPTMGGPQVGTQLDDLDHGQLISQSEFMRWGRQPIWSGGTYWPNWPQPLVSEKVDYLRKREELLELRAAAADTDDPSDDGAFNVRMWREMLDDRRPGEYFAVKEQKLFGWDEKKFADMDWKNLTRHERESQDHFDFHFVWRGDKIYRENTTEGMRNFYRNKKAICDVMHKNIMQFQDIYQNMERTPGLWCSMWNEWDYDLIDKRLRERHGIDILDKKARLNLKLRRPKQRKKHI
ncbi:oxidoreductase, aldo/keto reductase family protein [Toxoplasma gondii RUB]|uniref:Oxidoreductase, aldo/keto reductase family protein n=2 Tax=Toxoplasma gondii TaxID=5811 RepID=A0A086LY59_TOXGO|nr:oxidoreductase, aldo/keto reductase family protein [Toxoplasma gondii RUB]